MKFCLFYDIDNIRTILKFIQKNRSLLKTRLIFNDDGIFMKNIINEEIIKLFMEIRTDLSIYFPYCTQFNEDYHIEERNPAVHFIT